MLITNTTGVTETPELIVTKGIGQLIIATSETYADLATETISMYVEKAGKNKDIVTDMLLKDFMLLGTYGEDCLQSDSSFATIAVIDLTEDGGYIELGENETIKIRLRGLTTTSTYKLVGIEEPVASKEVLMFQRKTMATESMNQDFDVKGYDLLVLTRSASISEIAYTFDNGAVVKYTPFELECMQRSLDPVHLITQAGAVVSIAPDRFQLPLKGVVNVNIRKSVGSLLDVNLRIDEGDFALYQSHNQNHS